MSAFIATRLSTVSSSVSPFDVDDTPMLRLITSAESRLAAISNVVRVRVEFSKNKLNTALPRNSEPCTDVIGLDRQFAPAAVDQHRELDTCRPPEIEQFVDRSADAATGEQHVIHQHDRRAIDVELELAPARAALQAGARVVVA